MIHEKLCYLGPRSKNNQGDRVELDDVMIENSLMKIRIEAVWKRIQCPMRQINIKNIQMKKKNEEEPLEKDEGLTSNEFIGKINHAPQFMVDNLHIIDGYRIGFNSTKKILKSLFMLHNEIVNIWTHLGPALILIIFLASIAVGSSSQQTPLMIEKNSFQQNSNQTLSELVDSVKLDLKNRGFSEASWKEVRERFFLSYENFIQSIGQTIQNIDETAHEMESSVFEKYENLKLSLKEGLIEKLRDLENIKTEFQEKFVPNLLESINKNIDSSYMRQLIIKLEYLKEKLDSDDFKYIELGRSPNPEHVSRWPLIVFLVSAAICLSCSGLFHLFYPLSSKAYTIFNRFDYAAISILISGSAFPLLYYAMYCNFQVAIFYLSIAIGLGLLAFFITLFEWIHHPERRKWKGVLYASYGLYYVIPISHIMIDELLYANHGDPFTYSGSLVYLILMGMSYLIGLYVYVAQCPERQYPGKFDLCGSSHQIWHLCSLLGMLMTYLASLESLEMRKISICPLYTSFNDK